MLDSIWLSSAITIKMFVPNRRITPELRIEILLRKQALCILTQSACYVNIIQAAPALECGRKACVECQDQRNTSSEPGRNASVESLIQKPNMVTVQVFNSDNAESNH